MKSKTEDLLETQIGINTLLETYTKNQQKYLKTLIGERVGGDLSVPNLIESGGFLKTLKEEQLRTLSLIALFQDNSRRIEEAFFGINGHVEK